MCIAIQKTKGNCAAIDSAIRYNRAHITYKHWECLQNIKGRQTCYLHRRTQLARPRRQRKQRYSYTTIRTGEQIRIIRTKHENPHSYSAIRTGKGMAIRGTKHEQPHSYTAIRTGKGMAIHGTEQENPHSYAVKRIGKRMGRLSRRHGKQKVCKEILYAGQQDRLIYHPTKAFLPCRRRPSTPKKTPFLTLERHLLLSYSLTV